MSNRTISVIRAVLPDDLPSSHRVAALGRMTRWCCNYSGRVLSSPDNSFFIADVDGAAVAQLSRIVEVAGGVTYIKLLSSAFFEKLFVGEVAG